MPVDRRPSRPFRRFPQEAVDVGIQSAPPIHPLLVEHLQEAFAIVLAPEAKPGLDGAVDVATRMAEQRGREEVIAYLHLLATQQSS